MALGDGRIDELLLRESWSQHIAFEPFSRQRSDYPGTLMGVLASIRQHFSDALWYAESWQRFDEAPDIIERPRFDESLEALGPAARSEQPVVFSAWSDNAILRSLQLADELSLDGVVSGAIDGWRVADALAESGLPVLVSLDQRPRRDPVGFGSRSTGGLMDSPGAVDKKDAETNPGRLPRRQRSLRIHNARARETRELSSEPSQLRPCGPSRDGRARSVDHNAGAISGPRRELGNAQGGKSSPCRCCRRRSIRG